MDIETLARRSSQRVRLRILALLGAVILAAMNSARLRLGQEARKTQAAYDGLSEIEEDSSQSLSENNSLLELKSRDLARFRAQLSHLTQSRRALYEGGLQLQEEMRLLSKQWEIMTTYLLIDEEAKKIHLMRGEQSLESYPLANVPPQAYGEGVKPPPGVDQIVSKERFAHPERGKSEEVSGQLQWEPPQVGTSVRSNALGEFVMFTRGSLILHGPPKKPEEHQAFAHYCLGLSLAVAHRLYANSYIGTKIMIKQAQKPAIQAPPAKK